jgi:adenosylmethionine-8-amino-7-oxononanoate aminotransferase
MKAKGILIGKIGHALDEPENIVFLAPPLTTTVEDADTIAETLQDVLTNL